MTNNERIQANNAELREAIEMAEKLPEAGDGQTIYYTRAGACYVPNMIIEPSDGIYNASTLGSRYQYADYLETVEIPNIVLSGSVSNVFAFCSSLRTAKVAKVTNYGHYWFRNCTALETVQLGLLGYPVTNMTTLVFSGDTQTNLTITIYVDATTFAELPTTISNNSPFGATNATIVYRNSTTGEVISG